MNENDLLLHDLVDIGTLRDMIVTDFDDAAGAEFLDLAINCNVPERPLVEQWLSKRDDLVSVKCYEFLQRQKGENQ